MSIPLQLWYDARSQLTEYVINDLQGSPSNPILGEPLNRMVVGILHPQGSLSSDGDLETDGENESMVGVSRSSSRFGEPNNENDVSLTNVSRPSSMGLTVSVDPKVTSNIECAFTATRYIAPREDSNSEQQWTPDTISGSVDLQVSHSQGRPVKKTLFADTERGLVVSAVIRPARDGRARITLSIVNTNRVPKGERRDRYCWFRPKLTLRTLEGAFVDGQPHFSMTARNIELQELDFLYRDQKNLAIGHGCSPTWSDTDDEVDEISTTYFPSHEILLADPNAGSPNDPFGEYDLRMEIFADDGGYDNLDLLQSAYGNWIAFQEEQLRKEKPTLSDDEVSIGWANLRRARACHSRIVTGIETLRNDETGEVRTAFRLMNLAMIEQRSVGSTKPPRSSHKWRPFQIAFILMNLPGLADPHHDERDIADLLWFPTGGGKTEAYLGCISFSIFLRRIRYPEKGGVSAIMRYTLRLLTADQFDRAARLICAMEVVRRKHLPSSYKEISLGMWVGSKTTPNSIDDVRIELEKASSNPFHKEDKTLSYQVRKCPSCNTSVPLECYDIVNDSLLIRCPNSLCSFADGLPLYFVDDDVFSKRPSLVIGTVDKFAMMAWQPRVSELLSTDREELSPDLIIQDEFHLLSGPLGTMVGLYEGAIDLALTSTSGVKPKIIASTATIRQASGQARAIFNREAVQFPPAGLTPDDNYFSKTASKEELGTRKYVGVIAPGTSQATLLVRLYAALLQGVSELTPPAGVHPDDWQQVVDTYWTLLGYFNSLRVLGSASLQASDDIPDRVKILADRSGSEARAGLVERPPSELTSRKNSSEIALTREQMSKPYPDAETPNIVLATNMISVGLDIDRLGLMVVAGQPQNSSEYIQATSRVGRKHPGLVFVAFNANRTRDVSHFENFEFFHRTLYRSVEATTATPFSPRARDRGAHGVLVSASRLLFPELRGRNSAGSITEIESELRDRVVSPLIKRAEQINGHESEQNSALEKRLDDLINEWVELANREQSQGRTLTYGTMRNPRIGLQSNVEDSLLVQSGSYDGPDRFDELPPWETLTSLRDVDSETHLVLYEKKGK